MYPDKITKKFWLTLVEDNLNSNANEFLDKNTLEILKKLTEQAIVRYLRQTSNADCNISFASR